MTVIKNATYFKIVKKTGHVQNPPAFKIHSIKIHPIKINPSQNQPDQNLTKSKSTQSKSIRLKIYPSQNQPEPKPTCLIQPKSTQGQNYTSHVCKGLNFQQDASFQHCVTLACSFMFTLCHFRTLGHYYTGCHFLSASLLHLASLQHEPHFCTAQNLHQGDSFAQQHFCTVLHQHEGGTFALLQFCTA